MTNFDVKFNRDFAMPFERIQKDTSISDDAILNESKTGKISQNGRYTGWMSAFSRSDTEKAQNNQMRTRLLETLGLAFKLEGVSHENGRTTFSKDFMDRLEQLLGKDFKRSDFGISRDGEVTSGRPLTKRRISAILNKADSLGVTIRSSFDDAQYDISEFQVKSLGTSYDTLGCTRAQRAYAMEYFDSVDKAIGILKQLEKPGAEPLKANENGQWTITIDDRRRPILSTEDIEKFFKEIQLPFTLDDSFQPDNAESMRLLNRKIRGKLTSFVDNSVKAMHAADDSAKAGRLFKGLHDHLLVAEGFRIDDFAEFCAEFDPSLDDD